MKRIAAILLLSILLFNWVGYRLYSAYQEHEAENQLEANFDKSNFTDAQLVSVKIPVSRLGYYNSSVTFQRVDGQVEINGLQYKFVKRRLFQDSIEFLCVPNMAVMQMNSARDEFFKLVNDLSSNALNKKTAPHKNNSKNFSPDNYTLDNLEVLNHPCLVERMKSSYRPDEISTLFSATDEQPPDMLS